MLQRVPSRYKEGMSKMFQLLRSDTEFQSSFSMQQSDLAMTFSAHPLTFRAQPLTASGLHFALLDKRTVLQAKASQYTVSQVSIEIASIGAKMKSHCAGLIELSKDLNEGSSSSTPVDAVNNWDYPTVQFIHRSGAEHLWKEGVWNIVCPQTGHLSFDSRVAHLRSVVMQAKNVPLAPEMSISTRGTWWVPRSNLHTSWKKGKKQLRWNCWTLWKQR